MKKLLFGTACACALVAFGDRKIALSSLDLSTMTCGWERPQVGKNVGGFPLKIGEKTYTEGVGTHALSIYEVDVGGKAIAFSARVGADSGYPGAEWGTVKFFVLADEKPVAQSPIMKFGRAAHPIKADLRGAKRVTLVITNGGNGDCNDLADWCDAYFTVEDGATVTPVKPVADDNQFGILTPAAPLSPRFNPPHLYGVRPGSPILFTLPVSGERPMTFTAKGLPEGVKLDAATGVLTGSVAKPGTHEIVFTAKNAKGEATGAFKLVVGSKIALTPPMGWNSWNCFASAVSAKDIRAAADAFLESGLVQYGWRYVNVDDFWANYQAPKGHDDIRGPMRHADGTIVVNQKFGDMKALADYVHARGLKIGLYSSPGPLTCGACTGSWGHEAQDADTFAAWGYDYLKYDWCSYYKVAVGDGLPYHMTPYQLMGRELARQKRDIVFSICQYGVQDVSTWGAMCGGQCWRVSGDIKDTWSSMLGIVAIQRALWPFVKPGEWNDPDMLIVGKVGWGPKLHPTKLTANEQYSHITWWSLFAAPLLIGCDMTQLDAFTLNLLTNPEVLAVDQDERGAAAACVHSDAAGLFEEVWARPLADGTIALGIFNVSDRSRKISLDLKKIGLDGQWNARDLWRQKDEGPIGGVYAVELPPHAPHFLKLTPVAGSGKLAAGVADVRDAAWCRLLDGRKIEETVEACPGGVCPRPKK